MTSALTQEDSIDAILEELKNANARLGGKKNLDDQSAGLITTELEKNIRGSFSGPDHFKIYEMDRRWKKAHEDTYYASCKLARNVPRRFLAVGNSHK